MIGLYVKILTQALKVTVSFIVSGWLDVDLVPFMDDIVQKEIKKGENVLIGFLLLVPILVMCNTTILAKADDFKSELDEVLGEAWVRVKDF